MVKSRTGGAWAAVVLTMGIVAGLCVSVGSSGADVTSVKGEACGYYTNVGLFGGPQAKLGCEPQQGRSFAPASASTRSPAVTLPATGSATPVTETDADGAAGKYGPAVIFGGIWEDDVLSAPPSGPIKVSTQGTTGAGGSVVSLTDIGLHPTPVPVQCFAEEAGTTNCKAPGGFGPPPVWGDKLHVECSATETGVSGSTTFTKAFIAKATDAEGGPLPAETEAIPDKPPPNYTKHGVITNVGDVFTAVFNEQIVNADGSLTVNAVHMYLYGPVAVGDMVKGQVTCGTTPTTQKPDDKRPPTCGMKVVAPLGPDNPTPKVPREELIGVFDNGGLQSISNVQVTNATVQIGMFPNDDQDAGNDYLKFTPGQTGPLTLIATRSDESQPMTWSFDAIDKAGNKRTCDGTASPATDTPADDTTTTTTTTTTTVGGGSSSSTTTTTTQAAGGSSTTTTTAGSGSTTITTTRAGTATTATATQSAGATTATTRAPGTSTAAANTTASQVPVALTG